MHWLAAEEEVDLVEEKEIMAVMIFDGELWWSEESKQSPVKQRPLKCFDLTTPYQDLRKSAYPY